jgi:hypothetical protein
MSFNPVLVDLLANISANEEQTVLIWDSVQEWPEGALNGFLEAGFLVKGAYAQSIECTGCENRCFMDVLTLPHKDKALARAFVVCDDSDMQSQMGRIEIPTERLQQWKTSPKQLAALIAELLGLDTNPSYQKETASYQLGMLKGDKGRRWVTLSVKPLALVINHQTMLVSDLLYFEDGELLIDRLSVDEVLNSALSKTSKVYTPNTSKREAGKLATQAMYQNWKDEYLRLVKSHPNKPDTWYSVKIAKLDIAQDKDSETIRKNMKK